jgi:hypothetical protein
MSRKFIPVEEAAKEWMKRPEFVAAYDAVTTGGRSSVATS